CCVVRHDERHLKAHYAGNHRQGNTGVSAGCLHQLVAAPNLSTLHGTVDHAIGRPVFYASPRVVAFELANNLHTGVRAEVLQLNQWRISNQFMKSHGLLIVMRLEDNDVGLFSFAVVHFSLIVDFGVCGDTACKPHVPPYNAVMTDDGFSSQYGGPRINDNMIFKGRMTLFTCVIFAYTQSTEGNALINLYVIPDYSRLTDNDARPVVNAE